MSTQLIGAQTRTAPAERWTRRSGQWSLPRILRRDALLRRYLAGADILASAIAVLVVTKVVRDYRLHWSVALALLMVVPLAKVIGLYDRDELLLRKSTLDEGPAVLRLATAYTLWIWILAPILIYGSLHRDQIITLWGVLIVLLVLARAITRMLFNGRTAPERCMVVGEPCACEQVQGKLDGGRGINAAVVLALPFETEQEEALGMRTLAEADGLRDLSVSNNLHRLIIAPYDSDADHIRDLVQTANGLGLHVSIVPRMLEVIGSSVEFDDLNGLTVMGVQKFGLPRSSRLMKRTLDLIGSLIGLIVLSPLLAIFAVAIKLDSRGPVLFRQHRVGQDGKAFDMLKFRTMIDGADEMRASLAELNEADGLFKVAEDPRITRVGRVLRSLSLDELPQLVNVALGQMSLVGPRPLVVYEDERIEGFYRERLTLTPGMTGRWQILGSARIPLSEMVKLDYLYVANWSLWNDSKILLRTVPFVLGRRGM